MGPIRLSTASTARQRQNSNRVGLGHPRATFHRKDAPSTRFTARSRSTTRGAPSQRHGFAAATLDLRGGGDCRAMRYAAAQPKPSARRARPGVASNPPQVHLCAFIARLQRGGELPQDAGAVAAANLALLDVGAAFGGELVVGGLLGFEVAAFEPHPAEWARLSGTWGARNRTKIVRRGRGTKKSTGESRLAALPDAGQRGRHTKPPECDPFRGRGRVVSQYRCHHDNPGWPWQGECRAQQGCAHTVSSAARVAQDRPAPRLLCMAFQSTRI